LRTDNGLEFCNREFKLCIESGIARHLTIAETPQQNGLAERMNRTLIDKVRCLLIQSGLPKTFWAKATFTSRNVVFNKSVMYKDTLKDSGAGADKSVEELHVESPRQWYRRFDEYMLSNVFKRSSYDICVYYRSYAPGEYIYLSLYVDDMLIACKSKAEIGSTKSLLKREFDMKDLREAKKILGMGIVRDRSRKILRVSQFGYISKILNNFRIDNGKSV
nr:retrotransposon protein, putative, Ty1-copia subclass [Tanacetum cinerariifolium]